MVAEIAEDQILWVFLSLNKVIHLNFQRKQLVGFIQTSLCVFTLQRHLDYEFYHHDYVPKVLEWAVLVNKEKVKYL